MTVIKFISHRIIYNGLGLWIRTVFGSRFCGGQRRAQLYVLTKMIWGKLPALFVSCDQAHKISKCPALTLSKIHYNLAFNIHLNKQKYFFRVSYMSRTSARSNAVPYLHCPALTLSRTDIFKYLLILKTKFIQVLIYVLLIVGK